MIWLITQSLLPQNSFETQFSTHHDCEGKKHNNDRDKIKITQYKVPCFGDGVRTPYVALISLSGVQARAPIDVNDDTFHPVMIVEGTITSPTLLGIRRPNRPFVRVSYEYAIACVNCRNGPTLTFSRSDLFALYNICDILVEKLLLISCKQCTKLRTCLIKNNR